MAFAIFNPFCCCTASGILGVKDADVAQAMHSCCQSQSTDTPEEGSSTDGHDPADCPHRAVKDYEASLVKDATAVHDLVTLLPALMVAIEFIWAEPAAQPRHCVSLATTSAAPPIPLSQVYCIYRI